MTTGGVMPRKNVTVADPYPTRRRRAMAPPPQDVAKRSRIPGNTPGAGGEISQVIPCPARRRGVPVDLPGNPSGAEPDTVARNGGSSARKESTPWRT